MYEPESKNTTCRFNSESYFQLKWLLQFHSELYTQLSKREGQEFSPRPSLSLYAVALTLIIAISIIFLTW